MAKKEKSFLEQLNLDFKKMILGSVGLNILFLIFGIIIFMNVRITIGVVGTIVGIYFIVYGLFAILEFFMRDKLYIFKYKILVGILAIILGFFIMFNPFNFAKVITLTLGLYLIGISIGKLLETFDLRKRGYDGWLIMLVTSFILLIFGVFIAVNPMASMDLVQAMAIFIILSSILEICNLMMIYSRANEVAKLFKGE